jgi:hypothetical protein
MDPSRLSRKCPPNRASITVTNAFVRDAGYESGTIVQKNRKKDYIKAIDRALDKSECGDLAAILIEGYISQTEVRERITRRYRA